MQAKWNMRRMPGDLGHDVESSVSGIVDIQYRPPAYPAIFANRKGLLRTNASNDVTRIKRACYAVQNVAAVFDSDLTRVAEPAITNVDATVAYYEYRRRDGVPVYAFWTCGEIADRTLDKVCYSRPGDSFATRPTVFSVKGAPLANPVWVDLLTGRVYAFPKGNVRTADGETYYLDVPAYDSPCLLTERILAVGK